VYIQKNPGQTQFVVHFDSDGQMQMSDIPTFVQAFTDNPHLDIVLGSRYLGTSDNMPRNRKIMKK
jgi:GTP-binding protein EngB required for normal cell division